VQKLGVAKETLSVEYQSAWKQWLLQLSSDICAPCRVIVQALATLDCLQALASCAGLPGYDQHSPLLSLLLLLLLCEIC
jgi:hypothetical protein